MIDYEDIVKRGNRRLAQEDCKLLEQTVRQLKPKVIVEIGSMDGCSSLLFGCLAKEIGSKVYCIEPKPKGRWTDNIEDYDLQQTVTLIKAASPWLDLNVIPKPIDYLFIDGNHHTRWAMVDYHFFFPFISIGGMIAFHDYNGTKYFERNVRKAIDIILETDSELIEEVDHNDTSDKGVIVFKKLKG